MSSLDDTKFLNYFYKYNRTNMVNSYLNRGMKRKKAFYGNSTFTNLRRVQTRNYTEMVMCYMPKSMI